MSDNVIPADRIMNAAETAQMLGVSDSTLARLTGIPKIKLSPGRIGYRQSDVLAWMKSRPLVGA